VSAANTDIGVYFLVSVGSTWTYSVDRNRPILLYGDLSVTVISNNGNIYVAEYNELGTRSVVTAFATKPFAVLSSLLYDSTSGNLFNSATCSPAQIFLPYSTHANYSQVQTVAITSLTGEVTHRTSMVTVSGTESVIVPAGTFNALKVKMTDPAGVVNDYTAWYAENVGLIKSDNGVERQQLKAYTIK
jgi:hypothetical protein